MTLLLHSSERLGEQPVIEDLGPDLNAWKRHGDAFQDL
jgi:hypothetical protein